MTWLNLTTVSGDPVLINTVNAIQIKPHAKGAQLIFSTVAPNKEGKLQVRTITVAQSIEQINKALKATYVR